MHAVKLINNNNNNTSRKDKKTTKVPAKAKRLVNIKIDLKGNRDRVVVIPNFRTGPAMLKYGPADHTKLFYWPSLLKSSLPNGRLIISCSAWFHIHWTFKMDHSYTMHAAYPFE